VTFISSAGLSVILNAQRRLEESGGSLRVREPLPAVARLIQLSGLSGKLGLS
jgi:anti-anti-sigma factor